MNERRFTNFPEENIGLYGNAIGKRVELFLYIVFASSLGKICSILQGMALPGGEEIDKTVLMPVNEASVDAVKELFVVCSQCNYS